MTPRDRKPEPETSEAALDLEHELPPAEPDDGTATNSAPAVTAAPLDEAERARAERDALYDRLARLQAEFENYRKRAQREQAEYREYAVASALKSLFPILDSLERALQTKSDAAELRAGVELILRQFHDTLAKLGVQPVEAIGEIFDPAQHEAIEMVDRTDVPDHQIVEELQRGYKIKDRLLRPAMVRVARNPKG